MSRETLGSVIVTGAGAAGLAAACLLARQGFSVTCLSGSGAQTQDPQFRDPRTVALMQPAINLLDNIGIWPGMLHTISSPLRSLKLVDDTGALFAADPVVFTASEIGLDAFGWNIPLADLVTALRKTADGLGVNFIAQDARMLSWRGGTVTVTSEAGTQLTGQAVIAADGRASRMRAAAGISTVSWAYDQQAIAGAFAHSAGHFDASTEYHKAAGPLTTVPMPENRSSFVWMDRPEAADRLMTLEPAEFAKKLQFETHGDLGRITNVGARASFTMRGLTASVFARKRVFLVGEAAHVAPPIGAQGLNMSLRDSALAAELIGDAADWGGDVAPDTLTAQYDARRRADVVPRQGIIHMLNSSLLSSLAPVGGARSMALGAISAIQPLKQRVMRTGLAPESGLPRMMRG